MVIWVDTSPYYTKAFQGRFLQNISLKIHFKTQLIISYSLASKILLEVYESFVCYSR